MLRRHPATSELAFATRQLQPVEVEEPVRTRTTPLHMAAGFPFDAFDEAVEHFRTGEGYSYTRVANPTITAVERRIAQLEGGAEALLVGSGQAAIVVALLGLVGSGGHVVAGASLYEGTRSLLLEELARLGIATTFVVGDEPADWSAAVRDETRAVLAEAIPNPRNDLVDIRAVADVAHAHGVPLVVDSTLATPYLLRPIEHGADLVVHSASKFLAGQGSVLGGVIVDAGGFDAARDGERYPHLVARSRLGGPSRAERHGGLARMAALRDLAVRFGPTVSPLTAFLIGQGIETLSLRVERHSQNALAIAEWLARQPQVASVDYSGLAGSPYRALADRYLPRGQGSVFAFHLHGGQEAARRLVDALELFTQMTHLGDVRSLILHPRTTSHAQRTDAELEAAGIGPGTLRISVGIEDVDDLLRDLERGLAAAGA
ncbi:MULTISPECIES: O-acetylhomoserine aminocarboxypropyltransferase/cysteine synthase family protein [unclassified Agrococcus]|uniref:O-acetylhomoserine aminocarboxypropyltransferase/cysteine synthase family protein n=1 Tax=unclassified Agrococcus TaxID=2615065 RepID=UPI00360C4011